MHVVCCNWRGISIMLLRWGNGVVAARIVSTRRPSPSLSISRARALFLTLFVPLQLLHCAVRERFVLSLAIHSLFLEFLRFLHCISASIKRTTQNRKPNRLRSFNSHCCLLLLLLCNWANICTFYVYMYACMYLLCTPLLLCFVVLFWCSVFVFVFRFACCFLFCCLITSGSWA